MTSTSTWATAVGAALSAALLTACGGPAGSPLVHTAAGARQLVADLGATGDEPLAAAVQATQQLAQGVSASVRDLTITALVNAELAMDQGLGAMPIMVQTRAGQVRLTGVVASRQARERATRLAEGIDGVTAVDNQMTIDPRA